MSTQETTTKGPKVKGLNVGLAGLRDSIMSKPLPILAALIAIFWPYVYQKNYWIFTANAGLILAMSSLGLMVVVGWAREVSLMHAGLVGTATYYLGYLYRPEVDAAGNPGGKGYNYIIATVIAIAIVVGISALAALATLKLSGIYIMVLTLALQFTIERTFFAERKLTGGLTPLFTPRPEFLGIELTGDRTFYLFTLAVLGVCMLGLHRLRHSRYGRSLLLVGANRQAAASVGVSPFLYKLLAFCIGGFFAGMAGALAAPLYNTPPNSLQFFVFQSLFFLAVPVVAGFESLTAVLAVAMVFQLLPQALEPFGIDALVLGGAGLIVGTLAGPRGLSGNIKEMAGGLAARKARKTAASEGTLAHAGASGQG